MKEDLPLVSLLVFTYNHKAFIKETLDGALSQDYPNLEIVISDDCSTDGTFEFLQTLAKDYSGPHSLTVRKNEMNLGLVGHVNKILSEFAHGEYVMLSGGDDVCLSTTISGAMESIISTGLNSIAFNTYRIDANSVLIGKAVEERLEGVDVYSIDDYISGNFKTSGACRIFRKEIYSVFGPFASDCQTEDTPNLLRTFLYGKVGFGYKPNLYYRIHGNNISSLDSLMTKFDPRKIYEQYYRDIMVAYDKRLINEEQQKRLLEKIRLYLRIGVASRKIFAIQGYASRLLTAAMYIFRRGYCIYDVRNLIGQVRYWRKIEKQRGVIL